MNFTKYLQMYVEEALLILDTVLQGKVLNNLQELVFRQAWVGQTYPEIAESSGYNANYIKDVGSKLWSLLSSVFEEKVTKSNFISVLRRQYVALKSALVSRKIYEGESPKVYREDNVVSVGGSEDSGNEIAIPENITSANQIGESQQAVVVNTVIDASLNGNNINVDSQNTKLELLRAALDLVARKETTRSAKQIQDGFDHLLRQWLLHTLPIQEILVNGANFYPSST